MEISNNNTSIASSKFCVNRDCTISICIYYQKNFHQHNGQSQYVSREEIFQLIKTHQKFNQELYRQVATLRKENVKYLNRIYIDGYVEKLRTQRDKSYNIAFYQTMNKIKMKRFGDVTGKELGSFYMTLTKNNSNDVPKYMLQFKSRQLLRLQQDLSQIKIKEKEIADKQSKRLKQYNQKLESLNSKIKSDLQNSWFYAQRGDIYYKQKKFTDAFKDYNQALQYNPKQSMAYYGRAKYYYSQFKYLKATTDITKAIELNPNHSEALNLRGKLYMHYSQYPKALLNYNKAIELNPKNYQAHYNRSLYYLSINLKQAIIQINKALQLISFQNNKQYRFYYNIRAQAYQKLNELQKAYEDYNKSIQYQIEYLMNKPINKSTKYNYYQAYINRGKFYMNRSLFEYAISDFNTALQYYPQDKYILCLIGQAYFKLNDFQTAERYLIHSKNLSYLRYYLGRIYLNKNQLPKALNSFNSQNLFWTAELYLYRGITHSLLGNQTLYEEDYATAFGRYRSSKISIQYLKNIYKYQNKQIDKQNGIDNKKQNENGFVIR